MRIGIDCRMAGTGEGIARYVEELVRSLSKIDSQNDYFLLLHERANANFIRRRGQNAKFQNVLINSDYYSWAEQTKFIAELRRLRLDLVHFSSFNVPIFYPGKFVVTIHDIIHHLYPGKKKAHLLHRFAYRLVINSAVRRAAKIIAVSQGTRQDIVKTFHIEPEEIAVIYEGVDERFFQRVPLSKIQEIKEKYEISEPYLLFVGVWRQYKNLPRLAQAFDIIKDRQGFSGQLVLAGKIDPFYPEIRRAVLGTKFAQDIKALGYVSDEDLLALYQGAAAFVLPSLIEGFGLIGAEAQASGVAVVASDIPVLREVLGEGAMYFNPKNVGDIAEKISTVLSDNELRLKLELNGLARVKKYTWEEAARKTLKVYEMADKSADYDL